MIHPHTEVRFISDEIGYGLFALRTIPKGTITWVRDQLDRELTPEQLHGLPGPIQELALRYCYRNNRGNYLLLWDNSRYINHSFTPNCFHTPYSLEVAVRDIEPGEELTNDYGFFNIIEAFTIPGASGERTTVYPDDLRRHAPLWDQVLSQVYPLIQQHAQPLEPFFSKDHWHQVCRLSRGEIEVRSLISCFYDRQQPVSTGH